MICLESSIHLGTGEDYVCISLSRSQELTGMLGGFSKNIKATPCPCPRLDSFSWEARHNTAQCAVCFTTGTGTPLKFKGFQFPVLVTSEGNAKCLPPPSTQHSPPSLALLSWPLQGCHENQYRLCFINMSYVERALECLVSLFFYERVA